MNVMHHINPSGRLLTLAKFILLFYVPEDFRHTKPTMIKNEVVQWAGTPQLSKIDLTEEETQ